MTDSKRETIREVAERINALPEEKQNYVIGVMNGMLISYELAEKQKEPVA